MYTGFKIEVFEHQLNHNLFKFEKRFHIEKKREKKRVEGVLHFNFKNHLIFSIRETTNL